MKQVPVGQMTIPQTNWARIVSERGLVKISVIETDTATSEPTLALST
jgi:hypothetical protein